VAEELIQERLRHGLVDVAKTVPQGLEEQSPCDLRVLRPGRKILLECHEGCQELLLLLSEVSRVRLGDRSILEVRLHKNLNSDQESVRLVLSHIVSAGSQGGEGASDFGDELRELQEGQHSLSANLANKVGAASAVSLDQLKERGQLLLDLTLMVDVPSCVFLHAEILLACEETEGHESRS